MLISRQKTWTNGIDRSLSVIQYSKHCCTNPSVFSALREEHACRLQRNRLSHPDLDQFLVKLSFRFRLKLHTLKCLKRIQIFETVIFRHFYYLNSIHFLPDTTYLKSDCSEYVEITKSTGNGSHWLLTDS